MRRVTFLSTDSAVFVCRERTAPNWKALEFSHPTVYGTVPTDRSQVRLECLHKTRAPAVTAAVAGTLSAPVQGEKHIYMYTLGVTAPARMQINTRISNQYR